MRYEMIFKYIYVWGESMYVVICRQLPFNFVVYSEIVPYTIYCVLPTRA